MTSNQVDDSRNGSEGAVSELVGGHGQDGDCYPVTAGVVAEL